MDAIKEDDTLLRRLALETQEIGKTVKVKTRDKYDEYEAKIIDVIIIPFSNFYRNQFLSFYKRSNQNAVKALKELKATFPYTPDYSLNIGYILDTKSKGASTSELNEILERSQFDLL